MASFGAVPDVSAAVDGAAVRGCLFVRCRACARLLERLSVARRCSALRSATVGWPSPGCMLVSAFPSYLLSPHETSSRRPTTAFLAMLSSVFTYAASSVSVRSRSQTAAYLGLSTIHLFSNCKALIHYTRVRDSTHCLAWHPRLTVLQPTSACSAPSTPTRP